jgi:hypothetical protein
MKGQRANGYQPEPLAKMLPRLFVYVRQMMAGGALLPIARDAPIIFKADYSELDEAEQGDLFVLHRGRLLHAAMTAMDDTIMVEMPAESATLEQPLDD